LLEGSWWGEIRRDLEAEARKRQHSEKKKKLLDTYDALLAKEGQGTLTEQESTALAFMEGLMQ